MNVLSLFDGISCGMVALERANIKVDEYYASEIDKYANIISEKNYPGIIRLGDVAKIEYDKLPKIDLLIGGSPCQGFSFAGKQLNFDDPRSKLFFEFVKAKDILKPKYFLLENVRMKKEYQDIISNLLGVEPIMINSSLVSGQDRKRFYWTNIIAPGPLNIIDKNILLKDIVHENNNEKFDLEKYIVPFDKTLIILDQEVKRRKIGYYGSDSQRNRIYTIHDKSVTLVGNAGGRGAKTGLYLFGCITPDRLNKRQNGQRFNDGKKFYTLTAQDKHGIIIDGYIRKLTPIECERLQTLEDNYTKNVSNNQRYKMLGNGWTVDIIAHIFRNLK
jgi:DNA (cytosine-5)-methyltransferase 3A